MIRMLNLKTVIIRLMFAQTSNSRNSHEGAIVTVFLEARRIVQSLVGHRTDEWSEMNHEG